MVIKWPEIPLFLVSESSRFSELLKLDLPVSQGDACDLGLELYPSGQVDAFLLRDWGALEWDSPFNGHPHKFEQAEGVILKSTLNRPGNPLRELKRSSKAQAETLLKRDLPGKHHNLAYTDGVFDGVECFAVDQVLDSIWPWRINHVKVKTDGTVKRYLICTVEAEPPPQSVHNQKLVDYETMLRSNARRNE